MPSSDGQFPKKASTGTKKGDPTASYLDQPERETRASEVNMDTDDDDTMEPPRTSSSVIRRTNLVATPRMTAPQNSPIPPRRTGGQSQHTSAPLPVPLPASPYSRNKTRSQPLAGSKPKGKVHWLLPVGVGMIAMLILWEVGTLVLAWGLARYDDLRYGNPRTYQTDAVVGHGDSDIHPSHFIAINLNRQAIVVEFPAGNPAGAQSYVVPYYIVGPGSDSTPITVEFRDVTGDGKKDMIIHIHLQNQDQTFVFVNDGSKFRAPTSKDNIHL